MILGKPLELQEARWTDLAGSYDMSRMSRGVVLLALATHWRGHLAEARCRIWAFVVAAVAAHALGNSVSPHAL